MSLAAAVAAALSRIQNPRLDNDLFSAGMVRDLDVSPEGKVAKIYTGNEWKPEEIVAEIKATTD